MIDRSTRCFKVYQTFSVPLSSQKKRTKQKPLDRRLWKIGLRRPAGNDAIVLWVKREPGAEGPPTKLNKTESKTKP